MAFFLSSCIIMDPGLAAIIAALIAGGFTVVNEIRRRKRSETREAQLRRTVEQTLEDTPYGYGLRAAVTYSKVEVLNSDGDSRVTRGWRGLKVTPGISLAYIPGGFWIATPGSSIKQDPKLTKTPRNFPKEISLTVVERSEQSCQYRLDVAGSLTPNDPPLDCEIQIEYSRAVLTTLKAVQEAYSGDVIKRDYHSVDVDFPADHLELEVIFPANFVVKTFLMVCLGRSELVHELETKRVQDGFAPSERGATFAIEKPSFGFRYLIYWTPQSKG